MAKLNNPLLSLDASGSLGDDVTYSHRQKRPIVEKVARPIDAKSPPQLSWRTMFEKCTLLWHTLSAAEKQIWERLARPRHMTGYALWQSQCLRPNPGIYLPLVGGTMQGAIDMAANAITALPDPSTGQDADTLAARNAAITANLYTQGARVYHNAEQTAPHATGYSLHFNSERYDTDNIHSTELFNERLTCRTAGVYIISASVRFNGSVTGYRTVSFRRNGTDTIAQHNANANTFTYHSISLATLDFLSVNDYLECRVIQTTGGDLPINYSPNYSPEFAMQRIG